MTQLFQYYFEVKNKVCCALNYKDLLDFYSQRIYYPSQQCSKFYYHIERYFALEKELEKCQTRSKKKHYQGKETRLRKRISLIKERKEYHDWARWVFFQKQFKRIFIRRDKIS